MKKAFLVLAIALGLTQIVSAQAKSAYFELGGPGLASVNFDSRFTKSEAGIGGRIGIGGFSIDDASIIFVPIGINYLLGKDNKNYFEVGGGVTPVITNIERDGDTDNF